MNLKYRLISGLFIIMLISSCVQEDDVVNNTSTTAEIKSESFSIKAKMKQSFGLALVNSLSQSPSLRATLKEEALKKFNMDYEVLIYSILDTKLEDGITFEELIANNSSDFDLTTLLELEPTLTILVPELPNNSFSAELWDTNADTPAIAIRTNETNEVPLITSDNEIVMLPSHVIPGFPVLVVKNNERVVANQEYANFETLNTKTVYSGNGIELKFWSDDFAGRTQKFKDVETPRKTNDLDQVLQDAYEIYENDHPNLNGWQRDYIYYGIEPNNSDGPFSYDFQEHVRSFSMTGDATNAYNKISDQTGDPTYSNMGMIYTSHWTGGAYEFKVRTLINAKNGVGTQLINGFTVSPEELFLLDYETFTFNSGIGFHGGLFETTFYVVSDIHNLRINVDLPLINWDLDQYASSIKIEVEEVDLNTTTIIEDTRTVKFANNFEINLVPFGEKIKKGLKFGTTLETTDVHRVQKTFTEGNDFLGEAIINFADKVIIHYDRFGALFGRRWRTRDYSTGHCKFSVEPKRVQ